MFKQAIEKLKVGEEVWIKPRGNSMRPKILSGAEVRLAPVSELKVGDIVLARVKGNIYLHLIKAMDGERVQIGNNRGHINGWTSKAQVFGKAIQIKNPGS